MEIIKKADLSEEWKLIELKKLLDLNKAGCWGKEAADGKGTPVLRSTNFTKNFKLKLDEIAYREISNKDLENKKLKYGDLLLEKSGGGPKQPVGRVILFDIEDDKHYVCGNFIQMLRVKQELIYSKYLYYWLVLVHNKGYTELLQNQTTGIRNLRLDHYLKIKIPVPPLETQKKIVKILEKAEKLKEWRAEADKLADEFLKSVFLDMFDDPLKNPNNWSVDELKSVCTKITDGTHHSPPNSENGDFQYITAKNITRNGINLENVTFISKEIHDEIYKRCDPKKGDVLYIKDGVTTGIAAINDLDYEFSLLSSVALLKLGERLNPCYLVHLLSSENMYRRIRYDMGGAAITRLTLVKIKKIKIPVPPIELQNQFAEIVKQVETLKTHQKQSKQQIDNLFNALMQKAFKGELTC